MGDMVYCRACGREVHRMARNCPSCGAPIAPPGRYKDKTAAALLAFFVGSLGIHRFYLGQWWGIFYLLFCCTGIPSIVAFIEFIVFLCTSQESWDARHNNGQPNPGTGSNGWVWAILGVGVFFVMIMALGILAAIALPAYQDYTKRTHVSEGLTVASGLKASVAEYIASTGKFPPSMEATGFATPASLPPGVKGFELDQEHQAIIINYNSLVENKSIAITVRLNDQNVVFTCYKLEMNPRYVPSNCRN